MRQVRISTEKVSKRAETIESLEFEEQPATAGLQPSSTANVQKLKAEG